MPTERFNDYVTIRELDQRIAALRDLLDERATMVAKALETQAVEYLRRLQELNHAYEKEKENWRQSLPREVFEGFVGDYRTRHEALVQQVIANRQELTDNAKAITPLPQRLDSLEKKIDALQAERAGIRGGWGYAVGVFGFVLIMLSIAGAIIALLSQRP